MNRYLSKLYVVLMVLLAACSSTMDSVEKSSGDKSAEQSVCVDPKLEPETVSGKLDVYGAMARAAKYNTATMSENMRKKIYTANPNMTPKDIINNILNSGGTKEGQMYDGIRALDYAVIYASTYLAETPQAINDNLLEKSAQNLSLAAIKAHNDMLLVLKKAKDVNLIILSEQKELQEINKIYNERGRLAPEQDDYKKALELSIYKFKELQDNILSRGVEYRSLVKDKSDKPEVDGRKFYELDNLDKSLTTEVFQKSALYNRNEFKTVRKLGKNYTYKGIGNYINLTSDELSRLKINGYKANNPLYIEGLEKQAQKSANNLVDAVVTLQNNNKEERNFALKEKVYDELAAAIFTQIELAYNVVQMVNLDLAEVISQIKETKREVAILKNRELNYQLKAELLEKKAKLFALEMTKSQILGERTVAIRALYFYAGYAPFNCPLLKLAPKDIAQTLKIGFGVDAVKMLASVPVEKEDAEPEIVNDWAKSENWLENLMKEKSGDELGKEMVMNPESQFDLYTGEEPNFRKTLQLGVYNSHKNAEIEWRNLKDIYPDLQKFLPAMEKTKIKGKTHYRLIIKSANGGFRDLCNEMREDKIQCILK